MPTLDIEGFEAVKTENGTRLVLAIADAGIDIMHACGGNARCTTCRVEILKGEPEKITVAEKNKLAERGLSGMRLSCQIQCLNDMKLRVIHRLSDTGRPDPGQRPSQNITPKPEWSQD